MKIINVAYVKDNNYDEAIISRTYAFKSELALKEGNIIHVPTGPKNVLKRGIVVSIEDDRELPFVCKVIEEESLLHTLNSLSRDVVEASRVRPHHEEVEPEFIPPHVSVVQI